MSRLLVLLLLLLATALSGTAEASLRTVGPASHVVICADGEAVTLALGADGLPAAPGEHRRHCPDCLPLAMGAAPVVPSAFLVRPPAPPVLAAWPMAFPPRVADHAALPSSRGPPSGDSA